MAASVATLAPECGYKSLGDRRASAFNYLFGGGDINPPLVITNGAEEAVALSKNGIRVPMALINAYLKKLCKCN